MSVSDDAVAGAIGGMVARTMAAPFDVLKIRFQLQFGNQVKYGSISTALRDIIREEGVLSLWKGNLSASYLWVTYMAIQFGMYGGMKRFFENDGHNSLSKRIQTASSSSSSSTTQKSTITFLCGATAATVACASTYPFDIMRTQFVMQGKDRVVPTMRGFVSHTLAARGVSGFYAGLTPAVVGITPYMGLNFALFEKFKEILNHTDQQLFGQLNPVVMKIESVSGINLSAVFTSTKKGIAGGAAGGLSKLLVYPLGRIFAVSEVQSNI
jgi:solute carrier family 25 thiamine pyrophosphate transporter 19